jgi:hypothetical protein
LNHSLPNSWFFPFKRPYTCTLDTFSCLFSTCTREWSKLVIKITKGENSYHLCSWHQWPFGASWSWFQKIIIKSKLIQWIIYKRQQVSLHLKYFWDEIEYSWKITSKKNSQKIDSFFIMIKIIPHVTFLKLFVYAFIFHIKTHFFVNLVRVLNFTWLG